MTHSSCIVECIMRTIHLIDIENLCAGAFPSAHLAASVRTAYLAQLGGAQHHYVVACSHKAFSSVAWAWPAARRLVRSGENGADMALLDVARTEHLASRYDHVVIASGDGIFAELAAQLATDGVNITVIARPESTSKRLRLAAHQYVAFDHVTPTADSNMMEAA